VRRHRLLVALTLLLAAAAVVLTLLVSDASDERASRGATTAPAPPPPSRLTLAGLQPDRIIRRVEELRGLRLKRRPRFRVVPASRIDAIVRRQGERDGTEESPREERVSLALLKLLGLLPPGADLDRLQKTVSEQGILGLYDGARNEMIIVGRDGELPAAAEATVAHELVHAIDDQHFGIFRRLKVLARGPVDDVALAYQSLLEGSAEAVADRYAERYSVPRSAPGEEEQAERLRRELPFGMLLSLSFPYAFGSAFASSLGAPGDAPRLRAAFGERPPRSAVEIIDPRLYAADFRPTSVRVRAAAVLGDGWTAMQDEDRFSALDLVSLLAFTEEESVGASAIATSWRGGRYAYLRRRSDDGRGCTAPCLERDAFVGRVAMATPEAARRAAEAFGTVLVRHRRARPAGAGRWTVPGREGRSGAAAAIATGTTLALAYAPTPELAARLVRAND
jgi:hypothetical protein